MDIQQQFDHAFHGQPWHGKSAMEIIESSDPQKVFAHWIPNAHSIAELVLHLTVWTEEAMDRLRGQEAGTPNRGDWPPVTETTVQSWQRMVEGFRSAHKKLMEMTADFSSADWDHKTIDHREDSEDLADNYAELVNGIIQHLAYHSGQISLLQKF
jgi:uncharacterized damage-inducible protein DinB